ncbi:hypothetical protein [Erwinia rhapontici]|uniref:hypothetical protein n=1 Tax=Erwinia rhapontici TaxID=55212 RepID=UPI003D359DF9
MDPETLRGPGTQHIIDLLGDGVRPEQVRSKNIYAGDIRLGNIWPGKIIIPAFPFTQR